MVTLGSRRHVPGIPSDPSRPHWGDRAIRRFGLTGRRRVHAAAPMRPLPAPPGRLDATTEHPAWVVSPRLTESLEGPHRKARQALASAHHGWRLSRGAHDLDAPPAPIAGLGCAVRFATR